MIKIEGFTPEGFKVTLDLPCATVSEALAHVRAAIGSGITPEAPSPDSRKTETITTVIRREHEDRNGKITPVIDMYPTWKGDYGQFRFTCAYLNSAEDIATFERHAGVKLYDLPLFESQAPLQRDPGRRKKHEITCTPFTVSKVFTGEKEINGETQRIWRFAGYDRPLSQTVPTETAVPAQVGAAADARSADDIPF